MTTSKTETTPVLKFDARKALQGEPVITSDGRKVRVLFIHARGKYPVVALYQEPEGYDMVWLVGTDGKCYSAGVSVPKNDLWLTV